MPRHVIAHISVVGVPAWPDVAAAAEVAGVQTKPGDNRKCMSGPGINGDPATAAPFAEAHQIARGQGRTQQSRPVERERNRAGTVITAIVKRTVSAAPNIRLSPERVRSPDRIFYGLRSARRSVGNSVPQDRPIA